jgi:hypothetical protein
MRVQAIIVERERGATWLDSLIDLRRRDGIERSSA